MHDEDQSAHQFSLKDQSIQADSEERLELEMQATEVAAMLDSPSAGSRGMKSRRSINLSHMSPPVSKRSSPRKGSLQARQQDSLFGPVRR